MTVSPNCVLPGDRVSWRFTNAPRCFGTIFERRSANSFRVQGDDGAYRVIAARFITKECE